MTAATDVSARLAGLCRQLQQLPADCHWCYADEDLLRALARGTPVQRGRRGALLQRVLHGADRAGLGWMLVALIGAAGLLRLCLRQRRIASAGPAPRPQRFFVGFGAGSESALYRDYCARPGGAVAFIDQTALESCARWHRLGLGSALRSLRVALALAREAMTVLPPGLQHCRADFMTFIGIRIAGYAFARAWFAALRPTGEGRRPEVALLAADTCAFAAVAAGLPARFLQHGLLTCCVMPAFACIDALTPDEADFCRRSLPAGTAVSLAPPPVLPLASLVRERVLIASIYGTQADMELVLPLLAWTARQHLTVTVRPHPRENPRFWTQQATMPAVDGSDADFMAALSRLRPRLVVSWASTTLAQALQAGIIAVTVCADDDDLVAATVYPLFRRCLRWPADAALLSRVLRDDDCYAQELARLQQLPIPEAA